MEVMSEISNYIIDEILKVYPIGNILNDHVYEKAVSKVMEVYYRDKLTNVNMEDVEYNLSLMKEDWIEQLFLEEFTIDPEIMGKVMLSLNVTDK